MLAQTIGYVAFFLQLLAFLFAYQKHKMIVLMISIVFFMIQYFILHTDAGIILNMVSITSLFVGIVFYEFLEKHKEYTKLIIWGLNLLTVILVTLFILVLQWKPVFTDIFPFIGLEVFIFAVYTKEPYFQYLIICANLAIFVYNVAVFSLGGISSNIISIIIIFLSTLSPQYKKFSYYINKVKLIKK